METNISIQKIMGILVAIIVASCVLIPVCNAFSNNGGGDSPSPLATEVWENPGNRLTKIDLNDTSKTYTFSIDDGYEVGDTIAMIVDTGEPALYEGVTYTYVDGIGYTFRNNPLIPDTPLESVELRYNGEAWMLAGNGVDLDYIDSIYIADDNGEYYGSIFWTDSVDSPYILPQINLGTSGQFGITIGYGDDFVIGWDALITSDGIFKDNTYISYYDGDTDEETVYEVVSSPTLTINNQGFVEITNPKFVYLDNGNEVEVPMEYVGFVSGIYPQFVEIQSDGPTPGSDSGIAGTLIGIIPIFVLLAILGSVAVMFLNRNEIE